jgi:uncharacterized protein (TIGR02646 family)
MIPIIQNPTPESFTKWLNQEKTNLKALYHNYNTQKHNSADKVWAHLPSNTPHMADEGICYYSKKELKQELLQQQYNLCCYCGCHIQEDNADIEHLIPKSWDITQTFRYENLYASCIPKKNPRFADDGDTLETIIAKIKKEQNYTDDDMSANEITAKALSSLNNDIPPTQKLKKGDKVFIFIPDSNSRHCNAANSRHCNAARGDKEITIFPRATVTDYTKYDRGETKKEEPYNAKSCIEQFHFIQITKSVIIKTKTSDDQVTIDNLNLNHPELAYKRHKVWDNINKIWKQSISKLDKTEQIKKTQKLKENREKQTHREMIFVEIYYLKVKLDELKLNET